MANFNLNKVILGGRLTSEPELRQTNTGIPVSSFTVAVNRRFVSKNADAQQGQGAQTADFINVIAWRSNAEFVSRYFRKGSSICVVGSIQTRTWVDQQGTKRYATEVVADEVCFVDAKSEMHTVTQEVQPNAEDVRSCAGFEVLDNAEDLPF